MISILFVIVLMLVGFFSIRSALILLVFGSMFMSRYFGVQLGESGSALTLIRLLLPFTLILMIAIIVRRSESSLPKLNLFSIGIAHVLLVSFSTVVNGNLANLLYCFDWFLSSYVFVLFGGYCARSHRSEAFIARLVVLSSMILAFLAILEFSLGQTLLSIFSDLGLTSVDIVREKVLGRERDGIIRAQVFSDNPLRLAQFSNLLYALSLYFRGGERTTVYWLVAPLLLVTILLTGSRGGLLVFAVIFSLDIYRSTPGIKQKLVAKTLHAFIIVSFLWLLWIALEFLLIQQAMFEGTSYWMYDSRDRSSIERSLQVLWAFKQFLLSPIYGVGFLPNAGENLDSIASLDSYFLRSMLEGGVIGCLLFTTFALRYISKSFSSLSDRSVFGYLLMAICMFCGSLFEYTSETFIISFFFLGYFERKIFSGASVAMTTRSLTQNPMIDRAVHSQ